MRCEVKKFICILLVVCAAFVSTAFTACAKENTAASKYEIMAIYDSENRSLSGTVNFTYYNSTDNEIGDLKFNLYGNAFREGAAFSPVSATTKNNAYYG